MVKITRFALMLLMGYCLASCQGSVEVPAETLSTAEILGRWDVMQQMEAGDYPSWFEVEEVEGELQGRFVGKDGNARPIEEIRFTSGELYFKLPKQYEEVEGDVVFQGKLDGSEIRGVTFGAEGKEISFLAKPAPDLSAPDSVEWGEPIDLLAGSDLSNMWEVRYPAAPNGWTLTDGLLVNAPPSVDIMTRQKFRDFKLHVEFNMPELSNSGVYLRGRYEVQVSQDHGREPQIRGSGSIYGFIPPSANKALPPGEWNSYDITLLGRYVTVVYNGETVIDDHEIPGPTGGALDSHEGEPGPLLLQGDHQAIQYRNMVLTPAMR